MKCSCYNCLKKDVCKFAEKMERFAKEMNGMFEYPEWNKIEYTLKDAEKSCKFYDDKYKK